MRDDMGWGMADADLRELIATVTSAYSEGEQDAALWAKLRELGLSDLTGGDARGGSGAGWGEAVELVSAVARAGSRLPVGDSDLVAGWILDCADGEPTQALRIAWWDNGSDPMPQLHRLVERVTVVWDGEGQAVYADVDVAALHDRLDSGAWSAATTWLPLPHGVAELAALRGSLVRAIQVVGAMEAATEIAVSHARDRSQFGQPLLKFQAVQALVADLASETELARAATAAAIETLLEHGDDVGAVRPAVAVARSCVGHGAAVVSRAVHQVVGAIGTTQEHPLHRHTGAMLTWRSQFGDTRSADEQVLALALTGGTRFSDLDLDPTQ